MVPITAAVGDVQSWEASVPIKVPAGDGTKNTLKLFTSAVLRAVDIRFSIVVFSQRADTRLT
eukprot:COSAG03_NODE_15766_length_421_cov_0.785714_1_plen_62_part_00